MASYELTYIMKRQEEIRMKELELKYGCNPNQKPSKIYMADGREDLDTSISWMHLTAGSW